MKDFPSFGCEGKSLLAVPGVFELMTLDGSLGVVESVGQSECRSTDLGMSGCSRGYNWCRKPVPEGRE